MVNKVLIKMNDNASAGDFILDCTIKKRSLGYVIRIDEPTEMMRVKFPKINKEVWMISVNYGQYQVV